MAKDLYPGEGIFGLSEILFLEPALRRTEGLRKTCSGNPSNAVNPDKCYQESIPLWLFPAFVIGHPSPNTKIDSR